MSDSKIGNKLIVIVCGLPGVGKTTLANKLAPKINAVVLSTDKIRKELIKHPTYQKDERKLIFNVMILLAKYMNQLNKNCILDATFNLENSRQYVKKQLNLSKEQFFIVECQCPENIVLTRLKNRKKDYSDADMSVYYNMKKIYEPVKGEHIDVDTSSNSEDNANLVLNYIKNHKNE